MEYLLFIVWLILFAWIVTKTGFFKRSDLSNPQLSIIFLLKVIAGIFYGWIGLYYGTLANMSDTWALHYSGIQQYHLLKDNPHRYFTSLFGNPYDNSILNFFASGSSFWNDLKFNLLIKIFSVFDILSFGNYYINVIFYSFITMFGPVAVYKVMIDVFPKQKLPVLIGVFFIPSFLYWTSGMHKDGLIFTAISIIVYNIYFGLKEKKFGIGKIFFILIGLALILALRNYLIIIIVPALAAWLLANKWPKYTLAVFCGLYILFISFFFTAKYINPRFDFPQAVVNKQQEFLNLIGGSYVPVRKLEPTVTGFIKNAPQAFTLSTVRPYPGDVKDLLSLVASVETNLLLLIFLLFLFTRTNNITQRSFIFFCIFFSFSVLFTIGYTVNFLGAIVRYRSIVIPLLVAPMLAQVNWEELKWLFVKNIKQKNNVTKS